MKGYANSNTRLLLQAWGIYRKNKTALRKDIAETYAKEGALKGIKIIVTGTTSGLGFAIGAHLLALGATVICPQRNPRKNFKHEFTDAANSLGRKYSAPGSRFRPLTYSETENNVVLVAMDLANFESVKSAVGKLKEEVGVGEVDALVNNAGLVNPYSEVTDDGLELSLAVNGVGTALFTELLLQSNVLKRSCGVKNSSYRARIVSITSEEHRMSDPFDLSTSLARQPIFQVKSVNSVLQRYAMSKLVQSTYFASLQSKFDEMFVLDVCPGAVASKIASKIEGLHVVGSLVEWFMSLQLFGMLRPDEASLPMIRFLTAETPEKGHFLRAQRVEARADVYDPAVQAWLKRELEELFKPYAGL